MYITERKNPLGKIIPGTFTHAQASDRDAEDFIIFFRIVHSLTNSPAVTSVPAIVSRLTHIVSVPNPPHPYLL